MRFSGVSNSTCWVWHQLNNPKRTTKSHLSVFCVQLKTAEVQVAAEFNEKSDLDVLLRIDLIPCPAQNMRKMDRDGARFGYSKMGVFYLWTYLNLVDSKSNIYP